MVTALFWLALLNGNTVPFQGADDILGVWQTANNDSKIEIFKCGEEYCGKIIELREPTYPPDDPQGMGGQTRIDRENPDPALQKQPIIGLELMQGFSYKGNRWAGGTIYDPENGKTYKCKITLTDEGDLKVRGYIGIPALGRTEVWTR